MATISLYTQPLQQGMMSYQMGTFETTDLTPGTDYTQNYLEKVLVSSISKECYFLKITLATSALDNLDISNADNVYEAPGLKRYVDGSTEYYAPSNCNLQATSLTARPLDWDVHWRDKYNPFKNISDQYVIPSSRVGLGANTKLVYSTQSLPAPTTGGVPYDRPFSLNDPSYAENNQGRHSFWTMSDCYFGLESGWETYMLANIPNLRSYARAFYCDGNDDTVKNSYKYVNALRMRGMQGDYVPIPTPESFGSVYYKNYARVVDEYPSYVFTCFVQFEYAIQEQGGEVINEPMIGICLYEINGDGYLQGAVISAISEDFWKGKTKPPYTGPTSSVQGGQGTFGRHSTGDDGDKNGNAVSKIVSSWNDYSSNLFSGYNKYLITWGNGMTAYNQFIDQVMTPSLWQGFQNLMYSPLDAVVVCHYMCGDLVPAATGSEVIRMAGVPLSTDLAPTFSSMSGSYHVGSFNVEEYYGNYLDYADTAIYLHLPYIGTVQLDVSSCMGIGGIGWIAVDYTSDVLTGDVVAIVTVSDRNGIVRKRYDYKGNCAAQLPIKSYIPVGTSILTHAGGAILSTGLSVATGALAGAVVGSTLTEIYSQDWGVDIEDAGIQNARRSSARGGALNSAIGGINTIASGVGSALTGGQQVVSCNGQSGSASAPIDTTCWLLIVRPEWSNPDYYARENGYPSDIGHVVGDFEGLLSVASVELDGIECTDDERQEIFAQLKAGVYLDNRQT